MTPERWKKIKTLFESAVELRANKRAEYLNGKCGSDIELRKQIELLLNSSDAADTFLEIPAAEADTIFAEGSTLTAGDTTAGIPDNKFVSGTILDERYRIVGLLGKGGMGEVYKAEDLKLDQTVALKFLPDRLEKNPDALRRFIGEVRIARQVSHPNVCRVFDIGDIEGRHFISMEFIDGDDLSILLQRIGRLPSDKASEISRQICFGLHAIHDAGILHRDLKPANVIIDRVGKARITDFGIAGIDSEFQKEEIRVGTPAYMSPEQIDGKEVTVRSDIYSLGLLIYEVFTGKQAFTADSIDELLEKQRTTTPSNPSTLVKNIEPIVEKTITRCLEKDPAERPQNVMQVALALPGGNPLEAAIMAGETPSPEMVAAAPKKGALRPFAAFGILAVFIAVSFLIIALNLQWQAYAFTPFDKSPEILAERSRVILSSFGYEDVPVDTDYELVQDTSFLNYYGLVGNKHNLPKRKEMLTAGQPFDLYFLYRQSPKYLEPMDSVKVTENEPPLTAPGMVNLKLDVRGRLFEFVAVPAAQVNSPQIDAAIDWNEVFKKAGLDFAGFKEAKQEWPPPVFADKRMAWSGKMADFPEIPIRVETAQFGGKLVYFRVIAPWNSPSETSAEGENPFRRGGIILLILSIAAAVLGSVVLAFRNIKIGRGDLRGGMKLTSFLFAIGLVGQIIQADHVPTVWGELSIVYEAVSLAGITAVAVGLMYFALEPFVRRSWSELLISWSRLVAGDYRDPMVGRDILIGGLMGLGHQMGIHTGSLIFQTYVGSFDTVVSFYKLEPFNGLMPMIGDLMGSTVANIALGLVVVFIAFFFFMTTGKKYLGVLSVGLLFLALQLLIVISTFHWLLTVGSVLNAIFLIVALRWHGLLGVISFWVCFESIYLAPYTFDTNSFYFPASTLSLLLLLGLATCAAYFSIAGQPIFRGHSFDNAMNKN